MLNKLDTNGAIGAMIICLLIIAMVIMVVMVDSAGDKAREAQIEIDKYTYYTPCKLVQKSELVGNIFGDVYVRIYDSGECEPIKDAKPILGSEWNSANNKYRYGVVVTSDRS